MLCGSWNVRGWNCDTNSDNYGARYNCLQLYNLDIIAIIETHLWKEHKLIFDEYEWFGNNRSVMHRRARRGSGGVGFMVKKSLLNSFKCAVIDDEEEGIIWLKLSSG